MHSLFKICFGCCGGQPADEEPEAHAPLLGDSPADVGKPETDGNAPIPSEEAASEEVAPASEENSDQPACSGASLPVEEPEHPENEEETVAERLEQAAEVAQENVPVLAESLPTVDGAVDALVEEAGSDENRSKNASEIAFVPDDVVEKVTQLAEADTVVAPEQILTQEPLQSIADEAASAATAAVQAMTQHNAGRPPEPVGLSGRSSHRRGSSSRHSNRGPAEGAADASKAQGSGASTSSNKKRHRKKKKKGTAGAA